jgi:antirestriction protein ArdC
MIDIYQMVTDRVLKALAHDKVPWRRPWTISWPSNIATGKEYQGVNIMPLSCTEYDKPYWCTFRQAIQLGGAIRSGEKSSIFVIFVKESLYTTTDQEGNKVLKRGFILRYSPVFNISQTVGIDIPKPVEVEVVEAEEYLERAKAKPVIRYGGDHAF